jgi:predicted metal-dependent enzyme (double-stranded beta helix superfamily)
LVKECKLLDQAPANVSRLTRFTDALAALIDTAPSEAAILDRGGQLLAELVAHDDWLADDLAASDTVSYRQYLLYRDPAERFAVVSFVWGPGQKTPIHDHTVWGLVGLLRGEEIAQDFGFDADGRFTAGARHTLRPGQVAAVSPRIGDIHTVENALPDRASISIHVYGADIGKVSRATFDRDTGEAHPFVSGYSNVTV